MSISTYLDDTCVSRSINEPIKLTDYRIIDISIVKSPEYESMELIYEQAIKRISKACSVPYELLENTEYKAITEQMCKMREVSTAPRILLEKIYDDTPA